MRQRLVFLCSIWLTLYTTLSWAQQEVTINGTVTDSENNPIIGATVIIKGTTVGTTTDLDGTYRLKASPDQTLQFSYVGMQPQEIVVGNQTLIDVHMLDGEILEEVVVIGYGMIKKSDLTGAVSSMRAKDLMTNINTSVAGALQGKIPGVSVTNVSGEPGKGMSITVRGITSLTNNDPLYVIDGVYGDLHMIDPADIASIEVLKDASAAAIYGSRAASGVVLVSTHTGRKNTAAKLDLNVYTGIQQISKKLDVMNAAEWMNFLREKGQGAHLDGSRYAQSVSGKGTDWQDELYQSALMYKANIGIGGGSENAVYNTSVGYLSQEGIMRNTNYEAFTARMKTEFSFLNNRLKIGESLYFKSGKGTGYSDHSTVQDALRMSPIVPVYDNARETGWGAVEDWMNNMSNCVGSTYTNSNWGNDNRKSLDILFNGYLQLEILEGLQYKLNFSLDQSQINNRAYRKVFDFGAGGSNQLPDLSENSSHYKTWVLENTLHYDKTFDKHMVSALVGYSAQKYKIRNLSAMREELPVGTSVIGAGSASLQSNNGSAYHSGLLSFFGRVMYSYDSRYMLSASIRRDGSSKFEDGHRYGNFPSFSLGWNIHNEAFAEEWRSVVSELKLRASYGKLGNQQISDYMTKRTLSSSINYVQGDQWWLGNITGNNWVSPSDLTWETTETANIGLDASFLNGRLSLTADAFIQETKDVLMPVSMPGSAGLDGSPTLNAGTIQNKGFELAITHRHTVGEIYYSITANMSSISNKVKKITVGNEQEIGGYNPQGLGTITWFNIDEPMGVFRVIQTDGIFQSQAEVDAYRNVNGDLIQPAAQPGDIRFIDYNKDGAINDADRQTVGKPLPDVAFGLRGSVEWRGLDLNFFFDGMVGNSIYNFTRYRLENMEKYENYSKDILKAWTPGNTRTDVPRWSKMGDEVDPNKNARVNSDRWIEKGDFLRLKTLEIGYTLPKELTGKMMIDRLRLYTAMENLFTLTGYSGYTPDLGYTDNNTSYTALARGTDHGRYPQARTISFGMQIGF
ncbi:TonB-dependent receptor [Parabacteroides sp. 52]|uniref:SusC/RagA family TonB-linked outer membrane protein n=1 Tax=unclassified Parabacteroides TaxID=2649774 RepID=UPI0013D2745A|nr:MULTISPECIES: TonB-dependent receptor [unclassified Parabacteroides]MDH6535155.1 TonB-linked SusC/RagA family outer membrane protein [Parabacteroides sp. PM5-20]NDV56195.1 TonB-dependent receptor [Parabacteroides sp. 52]